MEEKKRGEKTGNHRKTIGESANGEGEIRAQGEVLQKEEKDQIVAIMKKKRASIEIWKYPFPECYYSFSSTG